MKTRERLALIICSMMLPFLGMSQCGTIHTLSYDSSITGNGGTDNPYNLTFPKFDASFGTLVDVKIISVLSIVYNYDVENTGAARTIKLRFNRDDEVTSSALSSPIYNSYTMPSPTTYINHPLGASDGVLGSGPDFLSVPPFNLLNADTIINQSASNPNNFLGSGDISFDYSSEMSYTLSPFGSASVTNTAATDQVKFVLQYVYCDNIVLASDITSFSAAKKDGYVNSIWVTANELPNRSYELQKSDDGKNFVAIATVPSKEGVNGKATYSYDYAPLTSEKDRLCFRIKQVINGVPTFSPVRVVDLGDAGEIKASIRLVPNPSSGAFSIVMSNNLVASDWNIELFNIKGQVISRKLAINSTLSKFAMNESLSAGVYFVLVTNKRNSQKFVERMVVN